MGVSLLVVPMSARRAFPKRVEGKAACESGSFSRNKVGAEEAAFIGTALSCNACLRR